MEVVIEIVEPGRRAPSVTRFSQSEILIGRAWDCDLVITDAEVEPHHICLNLNPETDTFGIKDLDSTNGVRVRGRKLDTDNPISFGEALTIGQTTFRVHRKSDPVAAVKVHSPIEQVCQKLGKPITALVLAGIGIFILQYMEFLGSGTRFQWNGQLSSLIGLTTGLVVWAIIWSGITKLLKHELRIWAHLGLASAVLITSVLLGEIESFLSFNLLSPTMAEVVQALNFSLMIFIWVSLGLTITSNIRPKTRTTVACVLVGLFLLTSFLLPRIQTKSWVFLVPLETQSQPPGMLLSPAISQESFIGLIEENIDKAKQRALEAREEKASES